jgi:hypothetical protein
MLTILVLVVSAVMVLVLVLLAVVVVGIKQEPPAEELKRQPPNVLTAWVRRMLGVYVRKPDQPPTHGEDCGEPCLSVRNPPAGRKGLRNEGPQQLFLTEGHHDPKTVSPSHGCRLSGLMRPDTEGGESHCGHTRSSR